MKVESEHPNFQVSPAQSDDWSNTSGIVEREGETFYKIADSGSLSPFLVNLVSPNNHWMFIASNGALTAGRRNADHALFPYYTQDKLFESCHSVGSATRLWVSISGRSEPSFWEPFNLGRNDGECRRNLYKNAIGNRILFEELNLELGLVFRYSWTFSECYGFVRKAELENLSQEEIEVRILDGIQNILPSGLSQTFVNQYSNLADAYKRSEFIPSESLALYYLNSIPTDRAEPSEGLRATVVWSQGIEVDSTLLTTTQFDAFRRNNDLYTELDERGKRGAFLQESRISLRARGSRAWWIVADIEKDAAQVEEVRAAIRSEALIERLERDIGKNAEDLRNKVAAVDGLTCTSNYLGNCRHFSNTLFNIMRGGIFNDGYQLEIKDFLCYVKGRNRKVWEVLRESSDPFFVSSESISYEGLVQWARNRGDPIIIRLAKEYLPLTFSRRHGDPSRPWNRFSIETEDRLGQPVLSYEGNWRDLFQNWEALSYSYPGFIEGMITRFLNTSTADGYNPYRITRDDIDWEIIEPDSPWSNIGYWGDHQIIYLLKLLEVATRFFPNLLRDQFDSKEYVFAQIPYRIRSFSDIWSNSRETIDFSDGDACEIANRTEKIGTDGKNLVDPNGELVTANLVEKLLAPLLAKVSNFIPDAGIWMNTQRPEWNDANNALVGNGISVVTLCYINRYLAFLHSLFIAEPEDRSFSLNQDIARFIEELRSVFDAFGKQLKTGYSERERYLMTEALGLVGEGFRSRLYDSGLSCDRSNISCRSLMDFINLVKRHVETSIDSNRRPDGMYHSYNLLNSESGASVGIDRLPEMLEGQVAALSSGRLSTESVLQLLQNLRESALYREDVQSYILYPDKILPSFLEKNVLSAKRVSESRLLSEMLELNDSRILKRDPTGQYRFCGDFKNSEDLVNVLKSLRADYSESASDFEIERIAILFEKTFDHHRFTGRSSTFFAYEGLGSVYWHMVSKLTLAIQENWVRANEVSADPAQISALAQRYFETCQGLGLEKSPDEYGAFPVDAYSHTPKHSGAQQPGMTGQVKEDILTRWTEIGIQIDSGKIRFAPGLLSQSSFLKEPEAFNYLGVDGVSQRRILNIGELAFTFCQTLFVYALGEDWKIVTSFSQGREETRESNYLSMEDSASIFARDGHVEVVTVTIPKESLLPD